MPPNNLPPLDLDFIAQRRSAWAGRLLLAVAVAFAGDVAWTYHQTRIAFDKNKSVLAKADRRNAQGKTQLKVSAEEVAAARDTVQRLSTPWEGLFTALESAATDQVALLAIEPDPKAGTVLITGDGKDYLSALSYVLNLGQTPALNRVQLVRHDAKANAVTFTVSAAWSRQ